MLENTLVDEHLLDVVEVHSRIDPDLDLRRSRPDVLAEIEHADVHAGDEPDGEEDREDGR
jgi:hypothetical protein